MNDSTIVKNCFKELQNKLRQIDGIDTAIGGICEKYWVLCDGKKYLFKIPKNDYSDFGEVFTSYLSYILGFKCVKSIFSKNPFKHDDRSGVLVENYVTKYVKETVSFSWLIDTYKRRKEGALSVNEAMEICRDFSKDTGINLDKNLEQDLKEMALMDYLLLQIDRHSKNIEFLIKEKKGVKTLSLAPMFDNGFCMFLTEDTKEIEKIYSSYSSKKIIPVESIISNIPPKFCLENNSGEDLIKEIVEELLQNKSLYRLYKNFKKVDLTSELNFINFLYKNKLPKKYIRTITLAIQNRINLLERELAKQKNNKREEVKWA